MHILITGGRGYIGSHIVKNLIDRNYHVIVLDWDQDGNHIANPHVTYITHDYGDQTMLHTIFTHYQCVAVIHCAAYIEVGESVKDPQKFYDNNVTKTITLLNTMLAHGIKNIIFSSSCAVYGIPYGTLNEDHPRNPISPYGNTKLIIERMLEDYARAYNLCYATLRYFNAAGASPEWGIGERHEPETHLIPLALRAAAHNKVFTIFGNDYATPDGTCMRDYLHVKDLAQAHYKALTYIIAGNASLICNLGTNNGYSVMHILDMVEQVTQQKLGRDVVARRPGDPDILVANVQRAQEILVWQPQHSSLHEIISSAWEFLPKKKESYGNFCSPEV